MVSFLVFRATPCLCHSRYKHPSSRARSPAEEVFPLSGAFHLLSGFFDFGVFLFVFLGIID
jgi:hypothetical protein